MKNLFAALLMIVVAAPALAGEALSARLAGEWLGVGVQSDGQDWRMELRLTPRGATVDYPDEPCGGAWGFSSVKAGEVTGTEIISYGRDLCIDNSTVVLTDHKKGQLLILWKTPDGSDLAVAVLHRKGSRPEDYEIDWDESRDAWNNR
jgi:hypothetical protein